MNIHLELAKMVCMGWRPRDFEAVLSAIGFHRDGTPSLNRSEVILINEAIQMLLSMRSLKAVIEDKSFVSENIVPPNNVSGTVKRRGCPPGGWPKKDKQAEHD